MVTDEDLRESQYRNSQSENWERNMNNQQQMENQEKGMIREQLNLTEELERISHLLRGESNLPNKNTGEMEWVAPTSSDDIILSEHGIALVLNFLSWYLNKNTLLSNYDEPTIMHKMEDLSISLADALFMSYEKYFRYPTESEINEKFIIKMEKKRDEIIFNLKIRNQEYNEEEIWNKLIFETNIIVERMKLKEQTIKNKLKGFDLLLREIQDCVHSAYNRAYKGQERRTLREHITISETSGGNQQRQVSGWSPLNWGRK